MKILKKPLVKLAISAVLIGFILWRIDKQALLNNFSLLDKRYIPLIVILLILNYIISSLRWKALLIYENTDHISVKYLTYLYFVGSFFNNFMPTSIGGDVFKVYKLGGKINSNSNAFSATFMERFTGVMALVLISSAALIDVLGAWGVGLFIGFWVSSGIALLSLKFLSTKITKLKGIYEALLSYKGQYRVLAWAFFTSFLVQLLAIFTQYFIFVALGTQLPLSYALFVFPVITLASFFIPSLNGVGVQDALYLKFFEVISIASTVSLSASILYHLFRLGVSLIGGIIYALGKAD